MTLTPAAQAPATASNTTRYFVPPRTDAERVICSVWGELFGCTVGAEDDFFELGGHSLLAARAASRIRAASDLPVSALAHFEAPTPAGLARLAATGPNTTEPNTSGPKE